MFLCFLLLFSSILFFFIFEIGQNSHFQPFSLTLSLSLSLLNPRRHRIFSTKERKAFMGFLHDAVTCMVQTTQRVYDWRFGVLDSTTFTTSTTTSTSTTTASPTFGRAAMDLNHLVRLCSRGTVVVSCITSFLERVMSNMSVLASMEKVSHANLDVDGKKADKREKGKRGRPKGSRNAKSALDRNTEHNDVPACLRRIDEYKTLVEEYMSSLRLADEYRDEIKKEMKRKRGGSGGGNGGNDDDAEQEQEQHHDCGVQWCPFPGEQKKKKIKEEFSEYFGRGEQQQQQQQQQHYNECVSCGDCGAQVRA